MDKRESKFYQETVFYKELLVFDPMLFISREIFWLRSKASLSSWKISLRSFFWKDAKCTKYNDRCCKPYNEQKNEISTCIEKVVANDSWAF